MKTQRLPMTASVDRYYIWTVEPDWAQGVVFLWKPASSATITAHASIVPLEVTETPSYIEVIPTGSSGDTDTASTDNPFSHLRIQESVAGGEFWVRSTGVIVEADSALGTPK